MAEPRSAYNAKRLNLAVCALMSACASGAAPNTNTAETVSTAAAVDDMAAKACPWPADVARFAQTTLVTRHQGAAPPDLDLLHGIKSGCAILTFSVDDAGIVNASDVVAEYPAGFGHIATQILGWNDYASGGSSLTVFMVRLGAGSLANGGALVALGFKDTTINFVVPAAAGR